jgi:glycosyltransferase involved in cell wall biosynthesis
MRPLRVALLADPADEGWPSMDFVADMLAAHLQREHGDRVACALVRPPIEHHARRVAGGRQAFSVDRLLTRMWAYPRLAARLGASHDVFHVIDHSYAQLVHHLPATKTVVTCHDLDTFRSVLNPRDEPRPLAFRAMTRHILRGLRRAAHVTCDSGSTREALVARAGINRHRTTVVYNGVDPVCTPAPDPDADAAAITLLGPPQPEIVELLHVGSTIPRKRIDVLIQTMAGLCAAGRTVRLIRAGGVFTHEQAALAERFQIADVTTVLPSLDRRTLAAVYRRAALLLLPSEREGFGLPLVEAMACGTPVVASDLGALKEVGGEAAVYCPVADGPAWVQAVKRLLAERARDPQVWSARRNRAVQRAAAFTWSHYATHMAGIYDRLVATRPC